MELKELKNKDEFKRNDILRFSILFLNEQTNFSFTEIK